VAKKTKRIFALPSPAELRTRLERACSEGRFQQGLELAKQLYKSEPTPPHRELLQRAYLGRARQLRRQGQLRDATVVLDNALKLGSAPPDWLEEIAEELAACGEGHKAQQVLARLPDSKARDRILTRAADAAMLRGTSGRDSLPEEQRGAFDAVVLTFARTEAGQDEQARELLQGIGAQSPFLEWKLLLRGLLAYYARDDARAMENWQRLDSERLPARLAAPFRFHIDPAFRAAQPPEVQSALRKRLERLQFDYLLSQLREIDAALHRDDLPRALRLAEAVLPELRRQQPQMVPKLAQCFYWALTEQGEPADVERYRRLFGSPADDPDFDRLRALIMEQRYQDLEGAHRAWQHYERFVASGSSAFPGEQGRLVRAMIWQRMGRNASLRAWPEQLQSATKLDLLPPQVRDLLGTLPRQQPLQPSAEQCFLQSLKLAPDRLEVHLDLVQHYQRGNRQADVEKASRRLLEHFPDHVPTLQQLGELYLKTQKYNDAITLFQRAVRINPLDGVLRDRLSTAHLGKARSLVENKQIDAARAEYQHALEHGQATGDNWAVYCKWSAGEFKAGHADRGEELLQKALAGAPAVVIAFHLLIESIRLKLPALKKRFHQELKAGLGQPPSVVAALLLLEAASAHRRADFEYHGHKSHERMVVAYAEKVLRFQPEEKQMQRMCESLLTLEAHKALKKFLHDARARFPKSPVFPFLEAESHFARGPQRLKYWIVSPLLERARHLAEALPPGPERDQLSERIGFREDLLEMTHHVMSPTFSMQLRQLGIPVGDDDDDWDDDD
jgi:tetratricopeptide (TPR) repeat protein